MYVALEVTRVPVCSLCLAGKHFFMLVCFPAKKRRPLLNRTLEKEGRCLTQPWSRLRVLQMQPCLRETWLQRIQDNNKHLLTFDSNGGLLLPCCMSRNERLLHALPMTVVVAVPSACLRHSVQRGCRSGCLQCAHAAQAEAQAEAQ